MSLKKSYMFSLGPSGYVVEDMKMFVGKDLFWGIWINFFAQYFIFINSLFTVFEKVFTSFFVFIQSVLLLIYEFMNSYNNYHKFIYLIKD